MGVRNRVDLDRKTFWRNNVGFWVLGLCNNFSYVIMLSAAHDILSKQESTNTTAEPPPPSPPSLPPPVQIQVSGRFDCNPVSTAAILLADILPTLLIKLASPFFIHLISYRFRVCFCCLSAIISFVVVSVSVSTWISLLGVVFASISSGLGEYTFLSLTAHFDSSVVSGWASGTGAAGLFGALSYSGLTQFGVTPKTTLQIMILVPIAQGFSYFFLLSTPPSLSILNSRASEDQARASEDQARASEDQARALEDQARALEDQAGGLEDQAEGLEDQAEGLEDQAEGREDQPLIQLETAGITDSTLSFSRKMRIIRGCLKYTVPLGLVYFAEYFINQGLFELLYFRHAFLDHSAQYRWYQTIYQAGVFISRSSGACIKIHRIWILTVLQFGNVIFLLADVWYSFVPSLWLVFAVILFEGLLGGAGYVNAFNSITLESEPGDREFAMGAASVADTLGIALSGVVSLPFHDWMCNLN